MPQGPGQASGGAAPSRRLQYLFRCDASVRSQADTF